VEELKKRLAQLIGGSDFLSTCQIKVGNKWM